MKFADNSSRRVLLREFFSNNNCDPYGIKKFDKLNTIVDIGANVGMFALQSRFMHPGAQIIAVEPDDRNYKILRDNVQHLKIDLAQFMLGLDGRGEVSGGGRSVTRKCVNSPLGKLSSKSLSSVVLEYEIDVPNCFFKIDCEGGELYMSKHQESLDVLLNSKGFGMEIHGDFGYWRKFANELSENFHVDVSGNNALNINAIRK